MTNTSGVRYLSDAEAHLLVCHTLDKEQERSGSRLAMVNPEDEDEEVSE